MDKTLWEEKKSIEQLSNYENSGENVLFDTTTIINRKFVVNEWKDITKKKISGIYKITNKVNGKYYIGSSKNIIGSQGRFNCHVRYLIGNYHENEHLQNAWNKYGKDAFVFEICELVNIDQLRLVEQRYLDNITDKDSVYNMSFLADRNEITEEVKKKISKSKIGKSYHTPEGIERQRKAISGTNSIWYGISKTGDTNPNWKGGVTHPKCIDCNQIISYKKKRCVSCNNKLNIISVDEPIKNKIKELYIKFGYKIARSYAIEHGITSCGKFYNVVRTAN